jgi:DNA-binding transcriptional regulator YdaS (Cro superfamily)
MKLLDWLAIPNADGSRKRRREFAARIGVTPSMVKGYAEDGVWAAKEKQEAIVRETEGLVTPNDALSDEAREIIRVAAERAAEPQREAAE